MRVVDLVFLAHLWPFMIFYRSFVVILVVILALERLFQSCFEAKSLAGASKSACLNSSSS